MEFKYDTAVKYAQGCTRLSADLSRSQRDGQALDRGRTKPAEDTGVVR